MITFVKRTWKKFVVDLKEDYRGNKKLLYAVMRNKMKPKTELCSVLDKNGKLVWTQEAYLRVWMVHFMELLNGQTDSEDITGNNYTTENNNVLDKIEVNMLEFETAIWQIKNNESSGYDKL
jgi:ferric iron reductase protein FhuF